MLDVLLGLGVYANNVYCLRDETQKVALVIDAAQGSFERLQPTLQGYQVYLILTHGHWDHLVDAAKFKKGLDTVVFLHQDDTIWLRPEQQRKIQPRDIYFDIHQDNTVGLNPKSQQKNQPKVIHFELLKNPDAWLDGKDRLNIGPWKIDILHLPGHSAGSVGVYLPKEKILFSGDTLFASAVGRSDLPGGSTKKLLQSLLFLSKLPVDVQVYPGHGDTTTIEQERCIAVKVQQRGSDKKPVARMVRLCANIAVLGKDQRENVDFYFGEEWLDPGKTFYDYGIKTGDCIEASRVSPQERARIQDQRWDIYSYSMIKEKIYPRYEWAVKQRMSASEKSIEEKFPTCIPEHRLGVDPLPVCW